LNGKATGRLIYDPVDVLFKHGKMGIWNGMDMGTKTYAMNLEKLGG